MARGPYTPAYPPARADGRPGCLSLTRAKALLESTSAYGVHLLVIAVLLDPNGAVMSIFEFESKNRKVFAPEIGNFLKNKCLSFSFHQAAFVINSVLMVLPCLVTFRA